MGYTATAGFLLLSALFMATTIAQPCPPGFSAAKDEDVLTDYKKDIYPISCAIGGDAACQKKYGPLAVCVTIPRGPTQCYASSAKVCPKAGAPKGPTATTTAVPSPPCPKDTKGYMDDNLLYNPGKGIYPPACKVTQECKTKHGPLAVCQTFTRGPTVCVVPISKLCTKTAGRKLISLN
jgi:hypothetical protein